MHSDLRTQAINEQLRSSSIAIKPVMNHYQSAEKTTSSDSYDNLYDLATWRMYLRIIDHRERNQMTIQESDCCESDASSQLLACSSAKEDAYDPNEMKRIQAPVEFSSTVPTSLRMENTPELFDGEVFELEL